MAQDYGLVVGLNKENDEYVVTRAEPNTDGLYELYVGQHYTLPAGVASRTLHAAGYEYVSKKKGDPDRELWQRQPKEDTSPVAPGIEVARVVTPSDTASANDVNLRATPYKCMLCGSDIGESIKVIPGPGGSQKIVSLRICLYAACTFASVETERK